MLLKKDRMLFWKKWAAKHECEQLKEGVWLEANQPLLRRKTNEVWTDENSNVTRKLFVARRWAQKRLVSWHYLQSCSVFVSFLALFSLSSIHHSRWSAAPNARCKCGAEWLFDICTVSFSTGASGSPESIWNSSSTQKASGKHRYPAESHCTAALCSYQFLDRDPDPTKSGSSSPSTLARMLDTPQSGSRSHAAIQILHPSGVTAALAERCRPPQRGRARTKFGRHIARYAMNSYKE